MKQFIACFPLVLFLLTPRLFAAEQTAIPEPKPISVEEKKQEFVAQLNSMCLTQTNKFIAMFDARGLQTQNKINQAQVCACVDKKMRADKYLKGIYTTDKSNPFQGYDKLKFKEYMGARHTAFLMGCMAPELDKVSAELSPLPAP